MAEDTAPPTEGSPLVLVTNDSSGESTPQGTEITHVLGGAKFSLDPSRLDKSTSLTDSPVMVAKLFALIALWPLLLWSSVFYAALMYVGPERLRHWALGKVIPYIMKVTAGRFDVERERLLSNIKEGDRILDVGCGGGAYLRHFAKAKEIVALEPVATMHGSIRRSAADAGISGSRLKVFEDDIESYLERDAGAAGSFDWVILGNVLCEVTDQASTLRAVDRALKVGGHVYFSEHIAHRKGTFKRQMQDFVNPAWKVVSGGCNCNRDTEDIIRSMAGWNVISWKFEKITVFMGPFVLGLIQKGPSST